MTLCSLDISPIFPHDISAILYSIVFVVVVNSGSGFGFSFDFCSNNPHFQLTEARRSKSFTLIKRQDSETGREASAEKTKIEIMLRDTCDAHCTCCISITHGSQ